ncbi:MAG: DUF1573 domain-containing protein [bacterium]|nr:DUF1573 domain-containing protein [bacterium]
MKGVHVLIAIVGGSVLLLVLGIFLTMDRSKPQVLSANAEAKVVTPTTNYDWGEIRMDNGKVEARFPIKNEGTQPLVLSEAQTSCMCTTATLSFQGKTSPPFGMHAKSAYTLQVPPGQEAELSVIFDPAFHGPNGVGQIDRQVTMATNDPLKPELTFFLKALVTR